MMLSYTSLALIITYLLYIELAKAFRLTNIISNTYSNRNIVYVTHLVDSDDLLVYKENSSDKPKFGIKNLDEVKAASSTSSISDTITNRNTKSSTSKATSAVFGSMTIDDLKKRMIPLENSEGKPLPKRTEDLNGINPVIPLFASSVPFVMAFAGYKLSSYLSANFAVQFLTSDIYTLQRIAIVARNILVGITTLGTTFCAVIGLGLFALGVTVAIGVLKGELDPNKKDLTLNDITTSISNSDTKDK